ncbi:MAG: DUF1028 domain-containing protein [Polyangiaceae bacterium]
MRRLVSCAVSALMVCASGEASATFSIVAVDVQDGSVGGAVASCVPLDTVRQVYDAVPGHGAIMTQSYLLPQAHSYGVAWLGAGESPSVILKTLTDPSFDGDYQLRQYALVSSTGDIANFTGSGANPFAGHLAFEVRDAQSQARRFVVSAQGNFLSAPDVLERARRGFEADACDLPERLINALLAAGSEGGGDARCTPSGTPAQSALIGVDPPDFPQGNYLELVSQVYEPVSEDPLPSLKIQFEGWRGVHPCPAPQAAGSGGSGGASDEALDEEQDGCRFVETSGAVRGRASRSHTSLPWLAVLALAALGGGLRRRYAAPHPRRTRR